MSHSSALAALHLAYTEAMQATQALLPQTTHSEAARLAFQKVFNLLHIHFLEVPLSSAEAISRSTYVYRFAKINAIALNTTLPPDVRLEAIAKYSTARVYKKSGPSRKRKKAANSRLTVGDDRGKMPG